MNDELREKIDNLGTTDEPIRFPWADSAAIAYIRKLRNEGSKNFRIGVDGETCVITRVR